MGKVSYHSKTFLHRNHDLRDYFLKITRETTNVLTIAVIRYFSSCKSIRSSRLEVFCKKGVLKILQNLQQKTCACGLQLYLKRESVTGV